MDIELDIIICGILLALILLALCVIANRLLKINNNICLFNENMSKGIVLILKELKDGKNNDRL